MTSATKTPASNRFEGWSDMIRTWLTRIVIAAVFFVAGAYIVAPMLAQGQPVYMPQAFVDLPLGAVTIMGADADSAGAMLPVRVASSTATRSQSFRGVGAEAMENQFVLYSLTRATSSRTNYPTENFGAPVDFAIADASGQIVAVHAGAPGSARVAVPESHQWVIVGKAGSLERLGVVVGASIDPASIRTF